jgi:hypothetical protein
MMQCARALDWEALDFNDFATHDHGSLFKTTQKRIEGIKVVYVSLDLKPGIVRYGVRLQVGNMRTDSASIDAKMRFRVIDA